MRLLLVEDDVRIHTFLSRALIEAGYQVDVVSVSGDLASPAIDVIENALS